MTPSGRAPVIETLRVASATLSAAPSHGSRAPTAWLASVVATSALLVPRTRRTAAPWPGSGDRVRADRRVVLLEDRPPRGEVRRADQRQQDRPGVHAPLRQSVADHRRGSRRRRRAPMGRRRGKPVVDDRVAGQGRRGHAGDLPAALDDRDVAVVRHPPDDGDRQAPSCADLADNLPPVGPHDGEHPLLRLGDQHFERLEIGLAPRHRVEVDPDPGARPVRGLRRRAGDAARAEVLETLHQAALDELERGLDQQLLGERIAHLNRRSLGRVVDGRRSRRPARTPRRSRPDPSWIRTARRGCPGRAQRPA